MDHIQHFYRGSYPLNELELFSLDSGLHNQHNVRHNKDLVITFPCVRSMGRGRLDGDMRQRESFFTYTTAFIATLEV